MSRFFVPFTTAAAIRYLLTFSAILFTLLTACKEEDDVLFPNNPAPTLTAIMPDSAFIGDTITLTGSGFSTEFIENVIRFNDSIPEYDVEAYGVVSATPTELRVIVPRNAISGPVTVAIGLGGDLSNPIDFKVRTDNSFTITAVTPDSASVGDTVTISGSNFVPDEIASVYFGELAQEQVTEIVSKSDTAVQVLVLNGAQSGAVTIQLTDETTIIGPVLTIVQPSITITSFTPASGPAGTEVIIRGENFSRDFTQVTLNKIELELDRDRSTSTQLVVSIPTGVQPGAYPFEITVENLDGDVVAQGTSADNFTVEAAAAASRYLYFVQGNAIYKAGFTDQGGVITANAPAVLYQEVGPFDLNPQDLAIDAANNQVYWTDRNTTSINTGKLDGSGANAVYTGGRSLDVGDDIRLDQAGDKLYWSEVQLGTIRRGEKTNTGSIDVLFNDVEAGDVTVAGEYIYWTDPRTESPRVMRGSINGGDAEELFNQGDNLRTPEGIQIDGANQKIYVADGNRILTGNLNGDGKMSLLVRLTKATGLFLDGNFLYCVDNGTRIVRVDVSGPNNQTPVVVIDKRQNLGFGIAVSDK